MDFQSYSQAGQDRFAFEQNGCKTNGTFVDIGCGHPTAYSNSYGLEKIGWHGICVDIHEEPAFRKERPKTPLYITDARDLYWPLVLDFFHGPIDYLSLDVDEASFDVLYTLPRKTIFRVITIEHDKYRLGPDQQVRQRALLRDRGYVLDKPDVLWEGKPFEDWYVHSSHALLNLNPNS